MEKHDVAVKADYASLVEGVAREELAQHRQSACCVERYDPSYSRHVPKVVVGADLGCGNPTKYLRAGDTVLDIGCGAGMNCYIAAQIAGPKGRIIGVDFTESMLKVAREAQAEFSSSQPKAAPLIFFAASAHDLALDLEWAERELAQTPITSLEQLRAYESCVAATRRSQPAIADASIDVVISNCVINLLDDLDKPSVFREMTRVLKPGGRFAISDNVSNIPVPERVKSDQLLWSACYAGVLQEQEFYAQLERAGFVNIRVEVRNPDPAHQVDDLIFYSVTVTGEKAHRVAEQPIKVMYRGPLKAVVGDSGKVYRRGASETFAAADSHLAADPEANGFMVLDTDVAAADVQRDQGDCCCD